MSDWTDLWEVMHDLSVAQGCLVPAELQAYGAKERPKLRKDDESLTKFEQNNDIDSPPDLQMIQEMLKMVKGNGDAPEPECTEASPSKLNPCSKEFGPRKNLHTRNVALTSILEAREKEYLTKSDNAIPSMFRRKKQDKNHTKVETSLANERSLDTSNTPNNNKDNKGMNNANKNTESQNNSERYIPSAMAQQYYKELLEKAAVKKEIANNLWSLVEKQIEISKEKKRVRESSSSTESGTTRSFVSLLQHRHLLTGSCVVCKVFDKHGYSFESTETDNFNELNLPQY